MMCFANRNAVPTLYPGVTEQVPFSKEVDRMPDFLMTEAVPTFGWDESTASEGHRTKAQISTGRGNITKFAHICSENIIIETH